MMYIFVVIVSLLVIATLNSVNTYWQIKKDWDFPMEEKVEVEVPHLVEEYRGFAPAFIN